MMYGFEFSITGNIVSQMQGISKQFSGIQEQAKAMQKQFDFIKPPTLGLPNFKSTMKKCLKKCWQTQATA